MIKCSPFNINDCTILYNVLTPTDNDISTLIKQTSSSSIPDPIPITLLKIINNVITLILRQLLTEYIKLYNIPQYFKQATMISRIKKSNMNINELSNYRTITQLPTLAKIFERLIS